MRRPDADAPFCAAGQVLQRNLSQPPALMYADMGSAELERPLDMACLRPGMYRCLKTGFLPSHEVEPNPVRAVQYHNRCQHPVRAASPEVCGHGVHTARGAPGHSMRPGIYQEAAAAEPHEQCADRQYPCMRHGPSPDGRDAPGLQSADGGAFLPFQPATALSCTSQLPTRCAHAPSSAFLHQWHANETSKLTAHLRLHPDCLKLKRGVPAFTANLKALFVIHSC